MSALESAAKSLYTMVDLNDDSSVTLSFFPTSSSTSFWKSWIYRESVRRTLVTCFYFLSVYQLLKENLKYCDHHLALTSIWTASAHLWDAESIDKFIAAWQEKKHFVVRELDFAKVIAEARPDDIDPFGKMLLIAYMGLDDARGWYHTRGGAL